MFVVGTCLAVALKQPNQTQSPKLNGLWSMNVRADWR